MIASGVLVVAVLAATPEGALAGRLVFRDDRGTYSAAQAQRLAGGDPLHLAFRLGADVIEAKPDREGFFRIAAAPGQWRAEYLAVGERAEFLPAHEVSVAEGELACAGTIEIAVKDLQTDLGTNVAGGAKVRVTDDCATLAPRLSSSRRGLRFRAVGLRPAAPIEHAAPRDALELLVGLRATIDSQVRLGASYVYSVNGPLSDGGTFRVQIQGARVIDESAPAPEYELGAGAGFRPPGFFSIFELWAGGGYRLGATPERGGPGAWAQLRFGDEAWGLGVRTEAFAGATGSRTGVYVTFDLSPVFLVGSFL